MAKKLIQRWMPSRTAILENKYLKIFGNSIFHTHLWHLNRHSTAKAFVIGLFACWIPVPFQMVISAGLAILFHANLPVSVLLVWLTNPVTMPVLFYISYRIGLMALGLPPSDFSFELSIDWLVNGLSSIWQPFLLGCLICGFISSALGYICVQMAWQHSVLKERKKRVTRYNLKKMNA